MNTFVRHNPWKGIGYIFKTAQSVSACSRFHPSSCTPSAPSRLTAAWSQHFSAQDSKHSLNPPLLLYTYICCLLPWWCSEHAVDATRRASFRVVRLSHALPHRRAVCCLAGEAPVQMFLWRTAGFLWLMISACLLLLSSFGLFVLWIQNLGLFSESMQPLWEPSAKSSRPIHFFHLDTLLLWQAVRMLSLSLA